MSKIPEVGSRWKFSSLDADDSPVFVVKESDRSSVLYAEDGVPDAATTERVTSEFMALFIPA